MGIKPIEVQNIQGIVNLESLQDYEGQLLYCIEELKRSDQEDIRAYLEQSFSELKDVVNLLLPAHKALLINSIFPDNYKQVQESKDIYRAVVNFFFFEQDLNKYPIESELNTADDIIKSMISHAESPSKLMAILRLLGIMKTSNGAKVSTVGFIRAIEEIASRENAFPELLRRLTSNYGLREKVKNFYNYNDD